MLNHMKPILFNTEMVRAILEGRKTVTRRVVRPQPKDVYRVLDGPLHKKMNTVGFDCGWRDDDPRTGSIETVKLPYRPGDILYVRETWERSMAGTYLYKATDTPLIHDGWRPSIHMPREAARIFLRVTDLRVERLQDITDDDMVRDFDFCLDAIKAVVRDALAGPFWDSTIKPTDRDLYGWAANPWVLVSEFEIISKEKVYEG